MLPATGGEADGLRNLQLGVPNGNWSLIEWADDMRHWIAARVAGKHEVKEHEWI